MHKGHDQNQALKETGTERARKRGYRRGWGGRRFGPDILKLRGTEAVSTEDGDSDSL